MPKRKRDVNPIDVVEAAYDLEADDRTWLAKLATCVRPLIDGGHGVLAYRFDISRPPTEWYADAAALDFATDDIPLIASLQSAVPDHTALIHAGFDGLMAIRELGYMAGLGDIRETAVVGPYFRHTGCEDFAALQTVEPGGRGIVICAGQSAVRTFDRRTRRLWTRVIAHIAAGRRLRGALGEQRDEVVLKPSGKVEHAEGEGTAKSSREALRDAVGRVEKSRGKQRKTDPEGATEAWTAMVSGRWSLVDRYERGGRRYIVARRNEHALPDPRALTPRERAIVHLAALGKPNKLIGYELGLSESTVGSHLSQAMRKLGASSRVELIRLLYALAKP